MNIISLLKQGSELLKSVVFQAILEKLLQQLLSNTTLLEDIKDTRISSIWNISSSGCGITEQEGLINLAYFFVLFSLPPPPTVSFVL